MSAEIANYLKRCSNPLFAVSAAYAFASRAAWALFFRSWPQATRWFLPDAVRVARRELLRVARQPVAIEPAQAIARWSMILAIGSLEGEGDPDWGQKFDDIEVTVSLHRWNWLLRALTDAPARLDREQGLRLMRSWIRQCGHDRELARDAYSTGERIVNGSLFLLLTGSEPIPRDIAAAFSAMGRQVAEHVEYHRLAHTGNHAFNNARALLFAGIVAKLPGATELAVAICEERLPQLINEEGFLREGSSHYHFLFTRWLLEMFWLARRARHDSLLRLFTRYGKMLLARCWSLLVRSEATDCWQLPLIGDVSPDFPPDWLAGLPWCTVACDIYCPVVLPPAPQLQGWQCLFGVSSGTDSSRPDDESAGFSSSGWARVDHQPWTIFIRAQPVDPAIEANHAHHDLASFVLFMDGNAVFVDNGRLDYTHSALGRYGKSALAHNAILIDELGATCDGPVWLSGRYRRVRVSTQASREGDEVIVAVRHDGFARLAGGKLIHQRRFRLDRTRVTIEDSLDGQGTHGVRLRLHLAPGIESDGAARSGLQLRQLPLRLLPPAQFDVHVQNGYADCGQGGMFFPAYGRQCATQTLEFAGVVTAPVVLHHTIVREH